MTLKASDIPKDGSSKLVLVDGTLFEVQRERSTMDARRSIYEARVVPMDSVLPPVTEAPINADAGWWYRFTWKLMLADLKLMAKQEDEE